MVMPPDELQMRAIAYMRGPYKQKFAVPRQPDLVREAIGEIHFEAEFADVNCVRGIEQFSHLWLLFHFHETATQGWTPTVTPPRLGGTTRVGVFATRSTFRPNAIGMSVVEFVDIQQRGAALILRVRGIDLVDGTPILDIKPYLPYADAKPDARGGYAENAPVNVLQINFTTDAQNQLAEFGREYPELQNFIIAVLQQDPRPAQHVRQESAREFGMFLYDLNIRWRVTGETCEVLQIEKAAK
ncbi:MAG: tRNA (N6-threonylcarbamoyladenosine(37)-N6)-methyltransferase TrmO [Pseudomonadota bacterium]